MTELQAILPFHFTILFFHFYIYLVFGNFQRVQTVTLKSVHTVASFLSGHNELKVSSTKDLLKVRIEVRKTTEAITAEVIILGE